MAHHFPFKRAWQAEPYAEHPWSRLIDVTLITPGGRTIDSLLRETLTDEFREWLEMNCPSARVCWLEIVVRDPNEAFVFRMRWGGLEGPNVNSPKRQWLNQTGLASAPVPRVLPKLSKLPPIWP